MSTATKRRLPSPAEYGKFLAERQKLRKQADKATGGLLEAINLRKNELDEAVQALRILLLTVNDMVGRVNDLADRVKVDELADRIDEIGVRVDTLPPPEPDLGVVHGTMTIEVESRDTNGDIKSAIVRPQRH